MGGAETHAVAAVLAKNHGASPASGGVAVTFSRRIGWVRYVFSDMLYDAFMRSTCPHTWAATSVQASSLRVRNIRIRRVCSRARHASWLEITDHRNEIDCVAAMGIARHFQRQGKTFSSPNGSSSPRMPLSRNFRFACHGWPPYAPKSSRTAASPKGLASPGRCPRCNFPRRPIHFGRLHQIGVSGARITNKGRKPASATQYAAGLRLPVTIPPDDYRTLRGAADFQCVSMVWVVCEAVHRYLCPQEGRPAA